MPAHSISKLVLASSNAGKLKEFSALLAQLDLEVVPQSNFQVEDAEETGLSFVENAIIKARHACRETGLPALADDSGLEVDALQGAPGIYSARFAGQGAGVTKNNQKLLESLVNVPDAERTGRYQCVLVFMRHAEDPVPLICQSFWEGVILREARGEGGFGYDPLFFIPELGMSVAELTPDVKHQHSHRGKAAAELLHALKQQLHHA
ncbi:RdgB/HAM1 family non-canonical purine NTP pyrophosphatase [Nitrincola alkalilacustris]|uniref:RdgB/HAM1 family non-canonical purine NTP pyrophosphatase n=1 Tax=Nitrincola alkalilacustris TaxID=1571224 RepID=UPI00124C10E4|nr:RdgB/HAM1 family non-canonical purine NTP pyrophosphatase [Nitrincola alkalilacustris]